MSALPLRSLAERAFKWSALTTAGRFALQLCAQVVLARLLGPENYGVYGLGLVVLTFAAFLSGNAFSYVLLLQREVNDQDIRFAFTWQAGAGLVCAIAMYWLAEPLAAWFGDPRLVSMVHWLSVACVLLALAAPATCLLQRELNFRALGLIQLLSYAAGYLAVGVPMALHGFGATSLAAAAVVQAAVALVATFAVRPHPIRPLFRHPMPGETLDTGRTVFFTNIVNWLLTNVDRIVVGRVLNAHAVGLYNVAYNLASIPNVLLNGALQPTFLATGARLQDDRPRLAQAWLTGMACLLVLLVPLALLAAALAGDVIDVLYGSKWTGAGWLLTVMFLSLPAWSCLGLSTPVLWTTGRKHLEALLQLPLLVVAVPAWWLLAPFGIRAVVLASALLIFARAAVIIATVLHALDLRWRMLVPFAARGLAIGGVSVLAALAAREAVQPLHQPVASLLAGGAGGVAVLVLLVLVRPQVFGREARSVLSRLIPAVGPSWTPPTPEPRP